MKNWINPLLSNCVFVAIAWLARLYFLDMEQGLLAEKSRWADVPMQIYYILLGVYLVIAISASAYFKKTRGCWNICGAHLVAALIFGALGLFICFPILGSLLVVTYAMVDLNRRSKRRKNSKPSKQDEASMGTERECASSRCHRLT